MWRRATPVEGRTPGWSTVGATPRAGAWCTPRAMSAARTSTIPVGSTAIPSAGPPWRPRVCKATSVCPVWATRSTASWMLTLPRAVSSRIQPCAIP